MIYVRDLCPLWRSIEAGGQAGNELAGELHDDTTDMRMDIDGGALPDIDNDNESMRYGNW